MPGLVPGIVISTPNQEAKTMASFMGFPFGEAKRNQPVDLKAANPLPTNAKRSDCGDAGIDGYSVLARANPVTGVRPPTGGSPDYWGPNEAQEQ